VDELFGAAIEMAAADRLPFLERECAGNAQLLHEVLSLLTHDSGSPTLSGPDPLDHMVAGAVDIVEDHAVAGQVLGQYRIEREIGRGGMSVVYLASRADGQFDKRVAIKLLKRGMDTQAVVARLWRERRILAALDHPYIARLLDGGSTADGLPYIVMDYVEGLPADQYCIERDLSIEERCELVARVCEAVAYAHRNLVVHRDLKPSNILVAADGTPRLLDFGIAKVLGGDVISETGPETRGPIRPLTPEYASPEQRSMLPVGTTSDVYSLGVVLYELLTGARPRDDNEKASAAALRNGKTKRWSQRLEGDLDTILRMALRPEPERRYLTMSQFGEDLRLHLSGMPVVAREETALYRWGKFLRRHRWGVAAAALIVLSLVGGLAATLWQARVAERERQLAEHRFEQVRELAGKFVFDLHDSIATLPGSTPARKLVVETGLHYYDTLMKDAGTNQPLLQEIANGYDRLGDAQGNPFYPNLGDRDAALASYQKAAAIRTSLTSDSPELTRDRIASLVRMAQLYLPQGKDKDAREVLGKAIDLGMKAGPSAPWDLRLGVARAYAVQGDVSFMRGSFTDALGSYQKVLEIAVAIAPDAKDRNKSDELLSLGHTKVGDALRNMDRSAEAFEHLRTALEIDRRRNASLPNNSTATRKMFITNMLIGNLLTSKAGSTLAKPAEVRSYLESAVALADKMATADPQNHTAVSDLILSHLSLATWLREDYLPGEAVPHFEKALEIAHRSLNTTAPAYYDAEVFVHADTSMSRALTDLGRYQEAHQHLDEATRFLQAMEKAKPHSDWTEMRGAELDDARGGVLAAEKSWAAAIPMFQKSAAAYEDLDRKNPSDTDYRANLPSVYARLADCDAAQNDVAAAIAAVRTSLDLYAKLAVSRSLSGDEASGRREARGKLEGWQREVTAKRQ
jgi:tetratricopeptide (TPR) repeat protein/tRNA A-37 threonylcarbamoyl transferase component Bud32